MAHGYDRSFLNRARVYLEGSGDALVPDPDQPIVSFTDPASGKTYTAWSFPMVDATGAAVRESNGEVVELGASARMVLKARDLAARCADPLLDADEVAAACAELTRYTTDLDLHVEMYAHFESATP
jgi:hypothetical protein